MTDRSHEKSASEILSPKPIFRSNTASVLSPSYLVRQDPFHIVRDPAGGLLDRQVGIVHPKRELVPMCPDPPVILNLTSNEGILPAHPLSGTSLEPRGDRLVDAVVMEARGGPLNQRDPTN